MTAELIMDEWDDLSLEHRRVGIGYVGYGRSAQVVPFLLSILPDVVDDELDFQAWCSSARPHPDERIVDAMRPHVEPLALVDVAYCFAAQCALLGIDRPELGFARWRTEHSLASEAARRQRTDGEI